MLTAIPRYSLRWVALFGAILLAWLLMFAMSLPDAGHGSTSLLPEHWQHAHHTTAGDAGTFVLFVMWALMALAMMAPSLVPSLRTFDDLLSAGAGRPLSFYMLIGGYLSAWVLFAVGATWLQLQLASWTLIDEAGRSESLWFNAALFAVAGAYQFSPVKDACLTRCRAPLGFFMANWRDGASGAFAMGLRLGLVCVACCWALMLLGFVGGVMSLLWMGAATVIMTFEKLPQWGRYLTRPLGAALLAGAVAMAITASV